MKYVFLFLNFVRITVSIYVPLAVLCLKIKAQNCLHKGKKELYIFEEIFKHLTK